MCFFWGGGRRLGPLFYIKGGPWAPFYGILEARLKYLALFVSDVEKKKQKNVHFQDEIQALETKEPVSAEQEHDICIFRSYCAIRNVMDAIVFCFENSDLELMNPIRIKNVIKPKQLFAAVSIDTGASISSSEGDESSAQSRGRSDKSSAEGTDQKPMEPSQAPGTTFEEMYRRRVWQRIQQSREHLRHLYPLAYRVEILENIFSLLFCRHSDILDGALMMDGDSDYDIEGESKADSTENLNTSIVSEEDAESEKVSVRDNVSMSSSVPRQTDSAIGSLGPDGKGEHSSSVEYDAPFRTPRMERSWQPKRSRIKSLESSDNLKPFSQPDYSCGFLANDYVVRDVLSMLKDALLDLSAVRFKMQGQAQEDRRQASNLLKQTPHSATKPSSVATPTREPSSEHQSGAKSSSSRGRPSHPPDKLNKSAESGDADFNPALEKLLSRTVSTSVTKETTQKRIAQLTQHIHEAQWRFQLVAHEQIPRQPGCVLEEVVVVTDDDSHVACITDEWVSPKRSPSAGELDFFFFFACWLVFKSKTHTRLKECF